MSSGCLKSRTAQLRKMAVSLGYTNEQIWACVGLPAFSRVQYDISEWIQYAHDHEGAPTDRVGIEAWRGCSKTFVMAGACCWWWMRDVEERILFISKSEGHSKKTLHMIRGWLPRCWFLEHLTPNKKIEGIRDSAEMFDVMGSFRDRTPSIMAMGITGQLPGNRATRIVLDDIETNENSRSSDEREHLQEQSQEPEAILVPEGKIYVLITPHAEETIADYFRTHGYYFRQWPAKMPHPHEMGDLDSLAPIYTEMREEGRVDGDAIWEERFSLKDLEKRELGMDGHEQIGRTGFARQFMLQRRLGDELKYPLKLQDLIVLDVPRDEGPTTVAWGKTNNRSGSTRLDDIKSVGFDNDGFYAPIFYSDRWLPFIGTKMWIDPSGMGKDKTAWSIVSCLNSFLFVKRCIGVDGGYGVDVLEQIAFEARMYGATEIYVESNLGLGMFGQMLQPVLQRYFVEPGANDEFPNGWHASINAGPETRATGQKEIRLINALEPVFAQHRLVVAREVAENLSLQGQIVRICDVKRCLTHDDEIDSLGMCVKMWTDYMRMDPVKNEELVWERHLDQVFAEQVASIGGPAVEEPNWINHH